jgi:hypothetical protein
VLKANINSLTSVENLRAFAGVFIRADQEKSVIDVNEN